MNYAKAIGAIALIAIIGIALWYLYHSGFDAGRDAVQVQWDNDKIKRDEDQKAALNAYADKLKQAEEQHDQDQATIDDLHDAAGRVRIHLPACADSAAAGKNPHGTAGVFPNRVDQLFAEFQTRVGGLIGRCDQLNVDAIRADSSR